MGEHIDLQIRPSLIIFVGEDARRIREQFGPSGLLAYLDASLRPCIGMLQMTTEGKDADPDMLEPFPSSGTFADGAPTAKGSLEKLLRDSLRSVQLEKRRLAVTSAGYAMPNTRTQVFIVGSLNDDNPIWMARMLRHVRELVESYHFETLVCYFLNCYKPIADYAATLKKAPNRPLSWKDFEVANFSYLYEHMVSYPFPAFLDEEDTRYATAEALLALVSTGITSSPIFESEMLLPPNFENYSHFVGSLSTSLILFPRKAISRYCSALLSADLIQHWYKKLYQSSISQEHRQLLQNRARAAVTEIAAWISESEPRPLTAGSGWPGLAILRRGNHPISEHNLAQEKELYHQLVDQSRELFKVFSYQEMKREYQRQRDKDKKWVDIANLHCNKAVNLFVRWEAVAINAWVSASHRIGEEVKRSVDKLWSNTDSGFEIAKIYVISLDNHLMRLEDQVNRWRQQHEAAYKEDRNRFHRLANEGAWNFSEDDLNIIGHTGPLSAAGQAKPTIVMGQKAGPDNLSGAGGQKQQVGGIIGGPGPQAGPQHLPEFEEKISLNLRRRATWMELQIPSFAVLGVVSFLFWLAAVFSLTRFPLPSSTQIIGDVLLAILCIVSVFLFRLQRQQNASQAKRDVLLFYQRYYVYRCECREDLQRMYIMKTLRARVMHMRERLETMMSFLAHVRDGAQQEAKDVCAQLFSGPSGVRDILIANGERLELHGDHKLSDVANQVNQVRYSHPLQKWHQTLDDMQNELVRALQRHTTSLLEMSETQTQEFLYDFTADIINGYLTGPLVEINAALDKEEIWLEVLDRVKKPLYFARTGILDPRLAFVCGSRKDLDRSAYYIPGDAITVETKSSEWLLVAAFFRGGEPTVIDADTLFPPKSKASSASSPPGGATTQSSNAQSPQP